MNSTASLPPWVRKELDHPAPPGQRHSQIVRVACALSRIAVPPEEIAGLLRPRYGADVSTQEIDSAVHWAASRNGTEFGRTIPACRPKKSGGSAGLSTPVEPEGEIQRLLSGFSIEEADLWEASPIRLSTDWREDSLLLLSTLFHSGELVNIVTRCSISGGKARPTGIGETRTREAWIREIEKNGTPECEGGSWIRMNPVSGVGVSDQDVTAFRFLLLECDGIPLPLQLSFFARLPLPIVALHSSGGRSFHAWVHVNARNSQEYREAASKIFHRLSRFGIDPANKNPSRLSRLPGALRRNGGGPDSRQRLLYLASRQRNSSRILP